MTMYSVDASVSSSNVAITQIAHDSFGQAPPTSAMALPLPVPPSPPRRYKATDAAAADDSGDIWPRQNDVKPHFVWSQLSAAVPRYESASKRSCWSFSSSGRRLHKARSRLLHQLLQHRLLLRAVFPFCGRPSRCKGARCTRRTLLQSHVPCSSCSRC
jgi:hypothetical protein